LWTVVAVGLITGGVTLLGGTLVLRFRNHLDLLSGFSSGTIIGVALFDLLPEGLDLAGDSHRPLGITTALAIGFASYLLVDRTSAIVVKLPARRLQLAPAALALHSLLDGLGIGLAFHVSSAAGVIVTIGVLAHDLVDGANMVTISLSAGASGAMARTWLIADAIAPLGGILLGSAITVSGSALAIMLGVFAGFFLYIGTNELMAQRHAGRAHISTIPMSIFGLVFIYGVIWLASLRP
jgi:ZIP family zinc transporter